MLICQMSTTMIRVIGLCKMLFVKKKETGLAHLGWSQLFLKRDNPGPFLLICNLFKHKFYTKL